MNVIARNGIPMPMASGESIFVLNFNAVSNYVNSLDTHISQRAPFFAANFAYGEAKVAVHPAIFTPLLCKAFSADITSRIGSDNAAAISDAEISVRPSARTA